MSDRFWLGKLNQCSLANVADVDGEGGAGLVSG